MKSQRAFNRTFKDPQAYHGVVREEVAMPRVETRYAHIVFEDSVPVISGTTMRVVQLIEESLASGWSPEEAQFQFPFLTMGQIHSALAYYWDHQDELDQEIERSLRRSDQLRSAAKSSPLRERLRANGLI